MINCTVEIVESNEKFDIVKLVGPEVEKILKISGTTTERKQDLAMAMISVSVAKAPRPGLNEVHPGLM